MITTYQYSKAHNRTQKVKDGVTSNYSYNNLNQLTGFSEPGRQVYFYYDDNGNRIRRTENGVVDTYAYDYENRLVSLQQGEVLYEYTYDYRTRRVERVEGDTRTKIVFSGGTSVQEYEAIPCEEGEAGGQESGSSGGQGCEELKVEYIRGSDYGGGIGGILYTLREGDPSYTHYNNRGDVVAKTDDEQAVTYQATYEAFGTRTHEVGETQDRQKANTKDEDPTGLLNEGFRYRDLETGSFITRDPLGHQEGPNFYTYVHQNPWTKFDPEGLGELDFHYYVDYFILRAKGYEATEANRIAGFNQYTDEHPSTAPGAFSPNATSEYHFVKGENEKKVKLNNSETQARNKEAWKQYAAGKQGGAYELGAARHGLGDTGFHEGCSNMHGGGDVDVPHAKVGKALDTAQALWDSTPDAGKSQTAKMKWEDIKKYLEKAFTYNAKDPDYNKRNDEKSRSERLQKLIEEHFKDKAQYDKSAFEREKDQFGTAVGAASAARKERRKHVEKAKPHRKKT